MTSRCKCTTITKRVLDWLVEQDDFATAAQIKDALKLTPNQVGITLRDLRRHRALDAIDVDGTLHWFATPESDCRTRHVDEVVDDIKRNRRPRRWLLYNEMTGYVRLGIEPGQEWGWATTPGGGTPLTIYRAKRLQAENPMYKFELVRIP